MNEPTKRVTKAIDFGDIVKDITKNKKGTVIAQTKYMTGCDRWIIQPEGTPLPEEIYCDIPLLISKCNYAIPERISFKFNLGDVVRDRVTKGKYVIYKLYQHISGFNRYYCRTLRPKDITETDTIISFEEVELELIKNIYVSKRIKEMKRKLSSKEVINSPSYSRISKKT